MPPTDGPDVVEDGAAASMRRTSRDPAAVRRRLEAWLATRLSASAHPRVHDVRSTSTTGMSSDTVLFSATWREGLDDRTERLVARLAPDAEDVPVFPSYDLERQAATMRLVRETSTVPVPRIWWSEPDPQPLGAPFFVMEQVDGVVPPDVMPYTFGWCWLYDAPVDAQRRLQDATVRVLAELHAIDRPEERFGFLALDGPGRPHSRRHLEHTRGWYRFAAADGTPSRLVERALGWLDERWPDEERPAVLAWGDARIGNVIYRDFEPVAVLDWEMAALGPRELDVSWLVYAHRVFDDLAGELGFEGMPHFLRLADVATAYETLTGYTPRDLELFMTYAAVQFAIVFLRTGRRQVRFGEITMPDDADELIRNRGPLERMLAGTYWT